MFPGHTRELSAAAFHLLALLEQYEQDTETVLGTAPCPPEVYTQWSARFEDMRLVALTVPDLHLPWLHVLISRAELVHILWRVQNGQDSQPRFDEAAVPHQDAIAALRNRAFRMIRSDTGAPLS